MPDEALPDPDDLEAVAMRVASGAMAKLDVAHWLRETLAAPER